jgi:hypothetical protein
MVGAHLLVTGTIVTSHCSSNRSPGDGTLATSEQEAFWEPHGQSEQSSSSTHKGTLFCHSSWRCLRRFSARWHRKLRVQPHSIRLRLVMDDWLMSHVGTPSCHYHRQRVVNVAHGHPSLTTKLSEWMRMCKTEYKDIVYVPTRIWAWNYEKVKEPSSVRRRPTP